MPITKKFGKTTLDAGRRGKYFGASLSRGKYQVGISNNQNAVEFYAGQYVETPREKSFGIKIPKKRKKQGSW